jgi:predicted HicB family RNase H-like nuclease
MQELKLRIRYQLHAKLKQSASDNDDSLNTEIINRLENSLALEDKLDELNQSSPAHR